jgi:CRISPR system Cascade subunit CasC
MPTGYGNSFAHRTLPSLVTVVVRNDQPVNLVSAFEEPVTATAGIAAESARRLAHAHTSAVRAWGDAPQYTAACHTFPQAHASTKVIAEAFGDALTFPELVSGVHAHLTEAAKEASR